MVTSFSKSAIAERATWQYRAIKHTRSNMTLLGCLVLGVLGRMPPRPPAIQAHGIISPEKRVFTGYWAKDGTEWVAHCLGTIQQVNDSWRRLADTIKATDAERVSMFDELRKWIAYDHSATPAPLN